MSTVKFVHPLQLVAIGRRALLVIDLSLPLNPVFLCGGILIGDNISNYMSNLYQQFADVQVEYKTPSTPD